MCTCRQSDTKLTTKRTRALIVSPLAQFNIDGAIHDEYSDVDKCNADDAEQQQQPAAKRQCMNNTVSTQTQLTFPARLDIWSLLGVFD
jgi:hypothetical protein